MSTELETITLTSGRTVRVNARDKARYASRGMIADQPATEAQATAPKAISIPRKKAKRPAEDKAVKPSDDKGEE